MEKYNSCYPALSCQRKHNQLELEHEYQWVSKSLSIPLSAMNEMCITEHLGFDIKMGRNICHHDEFNTEKSLSILLICSMNEMCIKKSIRIGYLDGKM